MSEAFLKLSPDDRREALVSAASCSGRQARVFGKDAFAVRALGGLGSFQLVLKGDMSLFKVYRAS